MCLALSPCLSCPRRFLAQQAASRVDMSLTLTHRYSSIPLLPPRPHLSSLIITLLGTIMPSLIVTHQPLLPLLPPRTPSLLPAFSLHASLCSTSGFLRLSASVCLFRSWPAPSAHIAGSPSACIGLCQQTEDGAASMAEFRCCFDVTRQV